MKKIYQTIVMLILIAGISAYLSSCSKDDSGREDGPVINYIRVTKPESADSLLVGAGQGQLIAIIGSNLKDVKQIFFNDRESVITPTYITNNTILVSVPSKVPDEITNKMRLIFENGIVLEHDFRTEINKPSISSMACEYVPSGGTAIIRGNYFYKPIKVVFNGGAEAQVLSVKDESLEVRVPEGAQPGQVTITTNFGTNKSDFWFRDNRNIFLSSDPYSGWWNESLVVKDPGPGDPPAINGNYIRVKQFLGAWGWLDVAGGPPDAMGQISKSIPDEAILNPRNYNLKFEINTLKPFKASSIKITAGLTQFTDNPYVLQPPLDTHGEWQTIVVPFDEVAASYKTPLVLSPEGYHTRIVLQGAGDLDADISLDNFRVVPKTIKK